MDGADMCENMDDWSLRELHLDYDRMRIQVRRLRRTADEAACRKAEARCEKVRRRYFNRLDRKHEKIASAFNAIGFPLTIVNIWCSWLMPGNVLNLIAWAIVGVLLLGMLWCLLNDRADLRGSAFFDGLKRLDSGLALVNCVLLGLTFLVPILKDLFAVTYILGCFLFLYAGMVWISVGRSGGSRGDGGE